MATVDAQPPKDQAYTLPASFGSKDAVGWIHPAALAGPKEIKLMSQRLAAGEEPWKAALAALRDKTAVPATTHALAVGHWPCRATRH